MQDSLVKVAGDAEVASLISGSTKAVMFDFWAQWCGPCKVLGMYLEQVAHRYSDKLDVYKIEAPENPKAMELCGVKSVPTLVVFRDGKEIKRIVGMRGVQQICSDLDQVV